MKTQKIILQFILIALLALAGCNNQPANNDSTNTQKTTEQVVYTCPMHPEVQSDKPGSCPKCGMNLVKKEMPEDSVHARKADSMPH